LFSLRDELLPAAYASLNLVFSSQGQYQPIRDIGYWKALRRDGSPKRALHSALQAVLRSNPKIAFVFPGHDGIRGSKFSPLGSRPKRQYAPCRMAALISSEMRSSYKVRKGLVKLKHYRACGVRLKNLRRPFSTAASTLLIIFLFSLIMLRVYTDKGQMVSIEVDAEDN